VEQWRGGPSRVVDHRRILNDGKLEAILSHLSKDTSEMYLACLGLRLYSTSIFLRGKIWELRRIQNWLLELFDME
jgi:hypothetical protein